MMKPIVIFPTSLWFVRAVVMYGFLGCPICGGHGAGAIGYFLLPGILNEIPEVPRKLGIIAIVSWLCGLAFYRRPVSWIISKAGTICLCSSWILFLGMSECLGIGISIFIPAALALVWWEIVREIKNPRTRWQYNLRDLLECVTYLAIVFGLWFFL